MQRKPLHKIYLSSMSTPLRFIYDRYSMYVLLSLLPHTSYYVLATTYQVPGTILGNILRIAAPRSRSPVGQKYFGECLLNPYLSPASETSENEMPTTQLH